MTAYLYLALSLALLTTGHLFKLLRQKSFLDVYEETDFSRLSAALAAGYACNLLLPLHLGDLVRGWYYGKKSKNGFPFAIATVVIDRFWDVIAVTAIFAGLFALDRGSRPVRRAMLLYLLITGVITAAAVFALRFTTRTKKCIRAAAGVFNLRLEFRLLLFGWSLISSLKDVTRAIDRRMFAARTALMWASYLLSYFCFARCVTSLTGTAYTTGDVLERVFGGTAFSAGSVAVMLRPDRTYATLYLLFFTVPLLLLMAVVLLTKKWTAPRPETVDHHTPLLPQMSEKDRLSFLQAYFSGDRRDYVKTYMRVNKEINIIRDCSAGSNATTLLCVDAAGRTFFRKYACGTEGEKLHAQKDWLEAYRDVLPLTEICGEKQGTDFYCYDMPCQVGCTDFFTFIHTTDLHAGEQILSHITEDLDRLHRTALSPADPEKLRAYIASKVTANLELVMNARELRPLMKYDTILINGIPYPNLSAYLDALSAGHLTQVFAEDQISVTHGDLTVENIVCCAAAQRGYYLIDPNPGQPHNTPFLDYAKLLQSLHGQYELMMKTAEVNVTKNEITFPFIGSSAYEKLFSYFCACLHRRFSDTQVRSIFYHEMVHWLRLMPYKLKNDPRHAPMFYAGMLKVMHEVIDLERYKEAAQGGTV